jgi:hypothetical protein
MRVDIRDGLAQAAVKKVLLNGQEVKGITMADSARGIIECYKTNAKGEFVHINGNLCKTELNGKVEIVFSQYWSMNADGDYVHKYGGKAEVHHNPLKQPKEINAES